MSESSKYYRVGLFMNPQKNDPVIHDLSEATKAACVLSNTNNGTPAAVWDELDNTIVLFACYQEFRPV